MSASMALRVDPARRRAGPLHPSVGTIPAAAWHRPARGDPFSRPPWPASLVYSSPPIRCSLSVVVAGFPVHSVQFARSLRAHDWNPMISSPVSAARPRPVSSNHALSLSTSRAIPHGGLSSTAEHRIVASPGLIAVLLSVPDHRDWAGSDALSTPAIRGTPTFLCLTCVGCRRSQPSGMISSSSAHSWIRCRARHGSGRPGSAGSISTSPASGLPSPRS